MADKTRTFSPRLLVVIALLGSSITKASKIDFPDTWLDDSKEDDWLLRKKSTNTVHSYWLKFKKGRALIDENIKINMQKQTEMFHVFSFDTVDEAIFLSDFKKNYTLIKLPKKNKCFLQHLNPIKPLPKQLMYSINKAIALKHRNQTIDIDIKEQSTWKIKGNAVDQSKLSPEMNKLCLSTPVYEIDRTNGQVYLQGLKKQGRSTIFQRAACGGKVCCYYWKWYCERIVKGKCVWVKIKVFACQTIHC